MKGTDNYYVVSDQEQHESGIEDTGPSNDESYTKYFGIEKSDSPTELWNNVQQQGGWNSWYQQIVKMEEDSVDEALRKYRLLAKAYMDFEEVSKTYAKLVIVEHVFKKETLASYRIPDTLSQGGTAEKASNSYRYVVRGILFTLVIDPCIKSGSSNMYLYGGKKPNYEYAAKSAGNALRAASRYWEVLGGKVTVPMQCLVDYRGFRCMTLALLPLTSNSQKYGVINDGLQILDRDINLRQFLEEAAGYLHLASHAVQDKLIHTACDIEGHLGTDGKYYLLSLARAFPPEAPSIVRNHLPTPCSSVLFRQFRPEYLLYTKSLGTPPLSPDGLTSWGVIDNVKHNNAICTTTTMLLEQQIVNYASELSQKPDLLEFPTSKQLHQMGINVRHMGMLRSKVTHEVPRNKLLLGMVSRTIKNILRAWLRVAATSTWQKEPDNSEFRSRAVVVRILNLVVSSAAPYDVRRFWVDVLVGLKKRFGNSALTEKEKVNDVFHTMCTTKANLLGLVQYVLTMTGFSLSQKCQTSFTAWLHSPPSDENNTDHHDSLESHIFGFTLFDLNPSNVRIKSMGILEYAIGRVLSLETHLNFFLDLSMENVDEVPHMVNYTTPNFQRLELSLQYFDQALSLNPMFMSARVEKIRNQGLLLEMARDFKASDTLLLVNIASGVDNATTPTPIILGLLRTLYQFWTSRQPNNPHLTNYAGASSRSHLLVSYYLGEKCRLLLGPQMNELIGNLIQEMEDAKKAREQAILTTFYSIIVQNIYDNWIGDQNPSEADVQKEMSKRTDILLQCLHLMNSDIKELIQHKRIQAFDGKYHENKEISMSFLPTNEMTTENMIEGWSEDGSLASKILLSRVQRRCVKVIFEQLLSSRFRLKNALRYRSILLRRLMLEAVQVGDVKSMGVFLELNTPVEALFSPPSLSFIVEMLTLEDAPNKINTLPVIEDGRESSGTDSNFDSDTCDEASDKSTDSNFDSEEEIEIKQPSFQPKSLSIKRVQSQRTPSRRSTLRVGVDVCMQAKENASQNVFGTLVSNAAVTAGSWYYEVHIHSIPDLLMIGWSQKMSHPLPFYAINNSKGNEKDIPNFLGAFLSTPYDLDTLVNTNVLKKGEWKSYKVSIGMEETSPLNFGFPFTFGDVIGCALNLEKEPNEIRYFLNGLDLGVAFSDFSIGNGLYPCALAKNMVSLRFVFDQMELANYVPALRKVYQPLQPSIPGKSALMHACEVGQEQAALVLIKAGANVNYQDKHQQTPLMYACVNGHTNIMKLLIHNRANVLLVDDQGDPALVMAATICEVDIALFLMQQHQMEIDLHQRKDEEGKTKKSQHATNSRSHIRRALEAANFSGCLDDLITAIPKNIVQSIAEDQTVAAGFKASNCTHWAASMGYSSFLKILLFQGNTEAKDSEKKNTYNININQEDSFGNTPLLHAIWKKIPKIDNQELDIPEIVSQNNLATVKVLLEKKANVNRTSNRLSPIAYASSVGELSIVKLLLEHKANVFHSDSALEDSNKILKENIGAESQKQDILVPEQNALLASSRTGRASVMTELISAGAALWNISETENQSFELIQRCIRQCCIDLEGSISGDEYNSRYTACMECFLTTGMFDQAMSKSEQAHTSKLEYKEDDFQNKGYLYWAINNKLIKVVRFLICRVQRVYSTENQLQYINKFNKQGKTPLMLAISLEDDGLESYGLVGLLLEIKARVDTKNDKGMTALMYASQSVKSGQHLNGLISKTNPSTILFLDKQCRSALTHAISCRGILWSKHLKVLLKGLKNKHKNHQIQQLVNALLIEIGRWDEKDVHSQTLFCSILKKCKRIDSMQKNTLNTFLHQEKKEIDKFSNNESLLVMTILHNQRLTPIISAEKISHVQCNECGNNCEVEISNQDIPATLDAWRCVDPKCEYKLCMRCLGNSIEHKDQEYCTFLLRGKEPLKQRLFVCWTCKPTEENTVVSKEKVGQDRENHLQRACCEFCKHKFHSGHDIKESIFSPTTFWCKSGGSYLQNTEGPIKISLLCKRIEKNKISAGTSTSTSTSTNTSTKTSTGTSTKTSTKTNTTDDLPPGWHRVLDPTSRRYYYANAKTQESTWEKPTM